MEIERAMKEKELMMEAQVKDAKLKYLQAQINPHFLFNTLNAGAQLAMMEGADRTYTYVQKVADFFRYNINKDQDEVTLRDEITLVDTYIYILNVRFAGEIHYQKQVDESLLDIQVPSMILQPIVENAVNYGIRGLDRDGLIETSVYQENGHTYISVWDNGHGMTKERIEEVLSRSETSQDVNNANSNGVGLANVIHRLELYYGVSCPLSIHSEGADQGTEIIIEIPERFL